MKKNPDFEITEVADDWLAVPLGDKVRQFNGVVVLSEETAFLLNRMDGEKSIADLVELLTSEYDITTDKAERDINDMVKKLIELDLINA